MKFGMLRSAFFVILTLNTLFSVAGTNGGGPGLPIKKDRKTVYVISIGLSNNENKYIKDSSNKIEFYNTSCPVCLTDATGLTAYIKQLRNKTVNQIDTVVAYQFINKDINLDSLYKVFVNIQNSAKPKDIFVFYYAGISLGKTFTNGAIEGFYAINKKIGIPDKDNIYSFNLRILKALTDRIAATRQLIIFDTGEGGIIEADYYKNFFSDNPAEAYFTRKNRIVICPEHMSSETNDPKDGTKKGDLFRVISNMPDSLNVFTLFDTTMYSRMTPHSVYKKFMKTWYEQQLDCGAQIKILKEVDYLRLLSAIKNNYAGSGKRGIGSDESGNPKSDEAALTMAKRKKKALIIATGDFDASGQWRPLKNAVNDGIAVADILQKEYGYEVQTVFNKPKDSILNAINNLCNEPANPYSQYIIYFAGHGFYDPRQHSGFIVCKNSRAIKDLARPNPVELDSYLDYRILFGVIDASLNKVVFITDVCFGGTSLNSVIQSHASTTPMSEKDKQKNPYKHVLASGVTEVDDFVRVQNGISENSPFAMALLGILKSKKDNFSFEDLYSEIKRKGLNPSPIDFIFGTDAKPSEFLF